MLKLKKEISLYGEKGKKEKTNLFELLLGVTAEIFGAMPVTSHRPAAAPRSCVATARTMMTH